MICQLKLDDYIPTLFAQLFQTENFKIRIAENDNDVVFVKE